MSHPASKRKSARYRMSHERKSDLQLCRVCVEMLMFMLLVACVDMGDERREKGKAERKPEGLRYSEAYGCGVEN